MASRTRTLAGDPGPARAPPRGRCRELTATPGCAADGGGGTTNGKPSRKRTLLPPDLRGRMKMRLAGTRRRSLREEVGFNTAVGQSIQGVFSDESSSEQEVFPKSEVKRKRSLGRHRKYGDQVNARGSGLTVLEKVVVTPEVMEK